MNNKQTPPPMTSVAPYMLRALVQWIVDNNQTPHILVDANVQNTEVPRNYVQPNGQIVLNISVMATEYLNIGDDFVTFHARFNGRSQQVFVPINAIISVFAKESGSGMCLTPMHRAENASSNDDVAPTEAAAPPPPPAAETPAPSAPRSRGHLRIVK